MSAEAPPDARNLYAVTKVCMEEMGRLYARKTGMSILTARIGWCPREPVHMKYNWLDRRAHSVYLSHRDAGRFFVLAVEASSLPGFAAVFVTSRCESGGVDLAPARRLVGYEPMDSFPEGCTVFDCPEVPPDDPDLAHALSGRQQHSSDRFP